MASSRREFLSSASAFGVSSLASFLPREVFGDTTYNEEEDRVMNPYRHGVFAPVAIEQTEQELKIVKGELPSDIEGSYIRNGPNPVHRTSPHHWFDGDGMLHEIRIEGGGASYRNRFIHTQAYLEERREGRKLYGGLQELSQPSYLSKLAAGAIFDQLPVKDTSHTDLIYFQKKLISLFWLSGVPYEVDPKTLKTQGRFQMNGYKRRHISAHARLDPKTGELFCLDFSKMDLWSPWVNVVCLDKDGSLKWDERFSLPHNRVYHDLLFTENYIILMDFPVGLDLGTLELKQFEEHSSRIVLISRKNPKIQHSFYRPSIDAPYVLHGMNAFEEDGVVKLMVCKYIRNPFGKEKVGVAEKEVPFVGPLRVETRATLWKLDIKNQSWTEEFAFEENTEFPRVNDDWLGRKGSRFSYHPELDNAPTVQLSHLIKYDWEKQKRVGVIKFGTDKKRVCEEFVFIPKKVEPSAEDPREDDGYLGSMVHTFESETEIKSNFEIYCASSLELVASIETPRVPAGFHSKWIPDLIPLQEWLGIAH